MQINRIVLLDLKISDDKREKGCRLGKRPQKKCLHCGGIRKLKPHPPRLSFSTINKLNNGENVTTEVLERICKTLNCKIEDIVEISEEDC